MMQVLSDLITLTLIMRDYIDVSSHAIPDDSSATVSRCRLAAVADLEMVRAAIP